jgi:DNA-binding LytR/AlgR family response regulator
MKRFQAWRMYWTGEHFLRVHKSFLVATDKIKLIQGNRIQLQDHQIPIGQTYRSRINHLLSGKS